MAVTGYSGLFNHIGGEAYAPLGRNDPFNGTLRSDLSRIFRSREGRKIAAYIKGAVNSTDAVSTHVQRPAVGADEYQFYGGVVDYETVTDVNKGLTVDDIAAINEVLSETTAAVPPTKDLSFNNAGSYLQNYGVI